MVGIPFHILSRQKMKCEGLLASEQCRLLWNANSIRVFGSSVYHSSIEFVKGADEEGSTQDNVLYFHHHVPLRNFFLAPITLGYANFSE